MSKAHADRNLLFGILALQNNFISRDQLLAAFNAWVVAKHRPLSEILLEQQALDADTQALLEALVQKLLAMHDGDAQQSLAAVSSIRSIRRDLEQIADPDLQASLAHVSAARDQDEELATRLPTTIGMSTSLGTRFRILRPHASGGLGQVYVAHDEELHREVALKEILARHAHNPEARTRFLVEAEITGGLEHPGIVPVYGLGHYADGRPFYAMRFIKGDSLKDAIRAFHEKANADYADYRREDATVSPLRDNRRNLRLDFSSLEFRKLLGRFLDVCNAIAYAHSRGVLHRDLKPGNIMLGKYGETLVVDWGLAKAVGRKDPATTSDEPTLHPPSASGSAETVPGSAIGTPHYMSPEQAAGRLDLLGPASDVYSLGATFYCVLTGKPPLADADVTTILRNVQRGEWLRPRLLKPELPAALEAVCLKAMALKPKDRYTSPQALADDIEHWLADEPVTAWPEPVSVKTGRWMRRHPALVSGAAAALLVAILGASGAGLWYVNDRAQRREEAASKHAVAEQGVRQAVDQAARLRANLHAVLKKQIPVEHLLGEPAHLPPQVKAKRKEPGGVRELLNQPARWAAQIQTAQAELQRAQDLAAGADAPLDPELTSRLAQLQQELAGDEADYRLALRLEKIRLDTAVIVEGKFNLAQAQREYPTAFADAGLDLAPAGEQEAARRIGQSAIKDQLLAALDDWAYMAAVGKDPERSSRLLALARRADPDPWRDQLRDPARWQKPQAMAELVGQIQAEDERLARLSPQILALLGRLLPAKDKEKWLRAAQALHPADFWMNFQLAVVLQDIKGKSAEGLGFYRAALALRPDSTAVYNNLGSALSDHKNLPAAVDAYKKALAIDPQDAKAWYNLGNALRDQKDLPAAVDACKKALAIDPQDAKAWYNLGFILYAQKNLPAAVDAYKKALAINPQDAHAWSNLGLALREQKDLPAAVDAFKKALAIDPQDAIAWNNLGGALYQKDLPAAVDAFKKALAIDPQFANAWSNLGVALRAQKDLPAAVDACKKALAIDPQDAIAWYNLGNALYTQKDLPAAIDAYKKALAIDPQYALGWYNLGIALRDQKDLPAVVDAFKKALAIDPQYAQAHGVLGQALRDQGDFAEAVAATRRALELLPKGDPLRSFVQRQLAQCQGLLKLDERLPMVLKDEKANPTEELALADLCLRYKQRYGDAAALFARAFAGEPKWAEDLSKGHRYNAACAAALAAAGKDEGADKLDDKDKSRLRRQALSWLGADLAGRATLLQHDPLAAVKTHDDLQHWQKDPDLAGVRDADELARLPADQRDAWGKLWAEVETLRKQARGSYRETRHKGELGPKQLEQIHPLPMSAGKTYVIDMHSPQFDTYLKLQDPDGKLLDKNDDIAEDNQNSRIVFSPAQAGVYRLVATSFEQRGSGPYTLTIREFKENR